MIKNIFEKDLSAMQLFTNSKYSLSKTVYIYLI